MRNRRVLVPALAALAWVAACAGPAGAQSPLLPVRGEATAPIVILLFSDFQCPYCARVEPVLKALRAEFPKDVQVVFKHSPLAIHPQAPLAHEAAIEAGRQGRFWEMHDLLFANQQKLQRDDLIAHGRTLGLDVAELTKALDDRRHRPAIERDLAEARALGVNGTPAIFINGRRTMGVPVQAQLTAFVRSLLNGGDGSETAAVPMETFDLRGSPARGAPDAAVTIVEFSDFQCGYCARATPTVARLLEQYAGRVRWVFKHYPLDFHPDAPLAHRASLAANQQGKFWEMHDAIFANQRAMKREDLLKHAASLGLDARRFASDLDAASGKATIDRDMAEGAKVGVEGTPTFFINGQRVVGAQPYEVFKTAVDRALTAKAPPSVEDLDLAMSRGPASAPVTIRWFGDVSSPLHRQALVLLRRIVDARPNDVRVRLLAYPSAERPNARLLHEAAASAAEQGRFWEMHDVLMARSDAADVNVIADYAARLGLDRARFLEGVSSGRAAKAVDRDLAEARTRHVKGTPAFFVNEQRVDGLVDAAALERIVADQLSRPGAGLESQAVR